QQPCKNALLHRTDHNPRSNERASRRTWMRAPPPDHASVYHHARETAAVQSADVDLGGGLRPGAAAVAALVSTPASSPDRLIAQRCVLGKRHGKRYVDRHVRFERDSTGVFVGNTSSGWGRDEELHRAPI